MKRAPFWPRYTALAGRGWILGAWGVAVLALATAPLWLHEPWQVIDFAVVISTLPALAAWVAPLGSLLMQARAGRELRLPRTQPLLRRHLAVLLALNLLPAAALIFSVSQDADWALYKVLVLLCLLLAEALLLLVPVVVLAFGGLLPLPLGQVAQWLAPVTWTNPLRVAAAAALAAALALLLRVLAGRYLRRATAGAGWDSCLLEQLQRWSDLGTLMLRSQRDAPAWMLPAVRVGHDTPIGLRVAHLLGQPYAPGFIRRTLGITAVVLLVAALAWRLWPMPAAGAAGPGLGLQQMLLMGLPWMAFSVPWVAMLRLGTLFGPQAPELTELRLLPGQGDARASARRVAGLLVSRLLQAQGLFAACVTLGLWWAGAPGVVPAVLASFGLLTALALLETARYLQRGRGWLKQQWLALMVSVVVVGGVQVLVTRSMAQASEDAAICQWLLGAAVVLLVVAGWQVWQALRQVDLGALAPQVERAPRAA